jgi:hypothetical protein
MHDQDPELLCWIIAYKIRIREQRYNPFPNYHKAFIVFRASVKNGLRLTG